MNRKMPLSMLLLTLATPALCFADDAPLAMSMASFSNPDGIPSSIRDECDLPAFQTDVLKRSLSAARIPVELVESDGVPATGKFLQVRIESAVSAGNAFTGHMKQVVVSTKLFENGVELAKETHTRESRGGMGAGFKGSCSVLRRCSETLGKDIAKWVKAQSRK